MKCPITFKSGAAACQDGMATLRTCLHLRLTGWIMCGTISGLSSESAVRIKSILILRNPDQAKLRSIPLHLWTIRAQGHTFTISLFSSLPDLKQDTDLFAGRDPLRVITAACL